MIWRGLLALALPCAAAAQAVVETQNGTSARLRALDLVTGEVTELDLQVGQEVRHERLDIRLLECRYPADNPAADAFAHLIIRDIREAQPRFDGWMISSSPALYALEHPRYDVWLLGCGATVAE